MFLSLALTIVQPESLTLDWNCNFRIRIILKHFHLLSVWGPRYYGSFWDCRWKRLGSKGHLGTLSLQGTKHPEISDVFFTGDEAPWNQLFFSGHSTCVKLIIMCVSMIFSAAKSMFSYVFDCIISFYPIFLPLHRKVPGIKMILSRSKRTFALIWRKYYKKKMTLSWCQTYIDMVMENSLSLTLSMSRISTFISTCTCIRRGVRSDAQLSCTETRFQKCSQNG